MPKKNENFNTELEGFLRANGFNKIETLDTKGAAVPDSSEADQFKFNYRNGNYDYGTVTITTHGGKVTVYNNESVGGDDGRGIDKNWTKFLRKLKDWALRNGQMGFSVKNLDRLNFDMKKRTKQKNEEQLLEGYYGTRNTSYSDGTPSIKMIIKHNKSLDEGDQRYRYIERIFLENEVGERVLVPSKKPSVGRAFARHLAEGGQYNDDRWNHIKEIAEDVSKLGGFVRATRSGQFNEGVGVVVNEAAGHYQRLRETIKRIGGSRGYQQYFEDWQPTLMEDDGEQDYAGMFTSSRLDPRIESAIPTLKKLRINVGELKEAEEFEEWANNIVEGRSPEMNKNIEDLVKLLQSDELPVGADAMSIKGQLEDIIFDDAHLEELFGELEDSARADPDNDAKPAIISWLQKNRNEEFYGDVLDELGKNEPAPSGEMAKAPAKEPTPQQAAPAPAPAAGGAEQFMQPPLTEKAKKPAQRNFVAKHAQRSGAGAHGKQGYQRHPKHKSKLGEEGVAEGWGAEPLAREVARGREEWRQVKEKYKNDPKILAALEKYDLHNWKAFPAEEEVLRKLSRQGVAEGIARNAKEKKLYELLEAWGYFITLKTAHIARNAIDNNAATELNAMARQYLGPVLNGMKFSEMLLGDLWQNPKVIPHLLKYIYQGIPYIEERIKKFVKPSEQQSYLSGIDKIKALYREVVAQYQQGVAEGSTSKEKQKTPYRDINSPEYKAAAEKQKEKMAKDKAAEPGKKLLDKIEKKDVAEDSMDQISRLKKLSGLK